MQRSLRERASAGKPAAGALRLLASRRFGALFVTQFLSAFNDNAVRNALVLLLAYGGGADGQRSARLLIPLAAGLFILPFFLCSATAGQIADETDKAWLIRLLKVLEIPLILAAAGGLLAGSAPLLLALLFVMGIDAAFFGPLKYAILPDLLGPEELLLGNALVEAGTFLAILFGTIAGTLIAARNGGIVVGLLIVLVAVAAWGASRAIPATGAAARRADGRWNLVAATVRILCEAAGDQAPFRAMLGISWFWLVGATYLSQLPAYVRYGLGAEEAVVTMFLVVFSVGVGLGSLLCNRLLGGKVGAGTVPWGALGIGLFSIDFWLASPPPATGPLAGLGGFLAAPAHWRILADLLGISLSGGIFIVPLYTLLQARSAPQRRARIIGANNVVNALAMVVSAVLTMALIAFGVSIPGLFLLSGLATLAVGAAFGLGLRGFSAGPTAVEPAGRGLAPQRPDEAARPRRDFVERRRRFGGERPARRRDAGEDG